MVKSLFFRFQFLLFPVLAVCVTRTSNENRLRSDVHADEKIIPVIREWLASPTKTPQTVEAFLEKLPQEFKESNRQVLVYESRSEQFASPLFPRIIAFTKYAQSVVAVTGAGRDEVVKHEGVEPKGHNLVEILEYDPDTKKYTAAQLAFPESGKPGIPELTEPSHCQDCHSERLHPNWEPYPKWSGTYGSSSSYSSIPIQETEAYQLFMETRATKHRFQYFPDLQTYRHSDGTFRRANTILSERLERINYERIVAEFDAAKKSPQWLELLFAGTYDDASFLKVSQRMNLSWRPSDLEGRRVFLDESHGQASQKRAERIRDGLGILIQKINQELERLGRETLPETFTLNENYLPSRPQNEWFELLKRWTLVADELGLSHKDWALMKEPGTYMHHDTQDKHLCIREALLRLLNGMELGRLVRSDCKFIEKPFPRHDRMLEQILAD